MNEYVRTLAPARRFGPWAADLDPGERLARLRSLRAIVRLHLGPRGEALCSALARAEADPAALVAAADDLDALAPLDMRRVLASFAGLTAPPSPARHRPAGPGTRAMLAPAVHTSPWRRPPSPPRWPRARAAAVSPAAVA